MGKHQLELPTIQNWSCHNCGGCCKQHAIYITEEERQRIDKQNWSADDEFPKDQPIIVEEKSWFGKPRHRLAHQADGSCAFLMENGYCRIHAKHGENAKPLACRIYPYAFHPAGNKIAVSLRFSCPSITSNLGKTCQENRSDILTLANAAIPKSHQKFDAPEIHPGQRVSWDDYLLIVNRLDAGLAETDKPFTTRLLRILGWLAFLNEAKFEKIQGERLAELLALIETATSEQDFETLTNIQEPPAMAQTQFRLLVAQYARKDTFAEDQMSWSARWKLLHSATKFAGGRGEAPPMQEFFQPVPFTKLQSPGDGLSEHADELLTRLFRVKTQGLHFCGPAYYDVPLIEGFQSLALMFPAVVFLARWLAFSDGRDSITDADFELAVNIADHHHGYSPAFGTTGFRRRVRMLAKNGDLLKIVAWYGR